MSEAKVIKVKVDNEKYEKFCKENGLDKNHKLSRIKYLAFELDNEEAQEFLELYEKGKVTLDDCSFWGNGHNPDIKDENLFKGFEGFITSVCKMLGCERLSKAKDYANLPNEDKKFIAELTVETFGSELLEIIKTICNGIGLAEIKVKMKKLEELIKGDEENDKEA